MADIENVMDDLMDIKERNKLSECEIRTISDAVALLLEKEHKDKIYHALEEDWKRLKRMLKEQEAEDEPTFDDWTAGEYPRE